MIYKKLFSIAFVIFCTGFQLENFTSASILKIVNEWNKATVSSIENQFHMSKNPKEKDKYKNRASTVPLYLDYEKVTSTKKSIRYDLIRNVLSRNQRNFYIVEADRSGEQVEIVSYLIIIGKKSAAVLVYEYLGKKWLPCSEYRACSLVFNTDLRKERVKPEKGINAEDVIISKFVGGKIVASEYYLDHTLSGNSGIEKVLEMRLTYREY